MQKICEMVPISFKCRFCHLRILNEIGLKMLSWINYLCIDRIDDGRTPKG